MSRWVATFWASAVLALVSASLAGAQPDVAKAKLDKAKAAYEKETVAAEKGVTDALEKAEAAARKRGDKAAVDRVKFDREFFELTGVVPQLVPASVLQKAVAARKPLDTAYAQAVKEYTKASRDDEAGALEKEWADFRNASVLRARYFVVVNKNSGLVLAAEKEKGDLGSGLVQAKNTGAENQLWSLVPTGTPDVYLLRNRASGFYASVGNSKNAGQVLSLDKDTGDSNRWTIERDGLHLMFQNVHSKLHFATAEASLEAGMRIIQWQKGDKSDEYRWGLVAAKSQ